ncbi:cAMP-regulated phosphoprotein Igo1 [Arthroderma uncinatum]|uniref:cAMP-regulated phosphoprotein Igo1 n=1 Tax=Arthroderma uncinatum TaxID=74035 RepID=UPI00144AC8F4|nr:cAMP-regulated phosphoprotein Igo1 [Arthroderma uncinatum]KAF3492089.1 cAMP-regulated phosphoprotein Igo1 [Arthroderma uncinatum]
MNPHQQNKIDINSLSPDEQRLLRMYGKMPNKKDLLQNKLKERKYFDSGDYALSKAGKASDVTTIGSRHPLPENIPHLTASSPPQVNATPNHFNGHAPTHSHSGGTNNGMSPGMSRSPIKEGSFLQRQASMEDSNANDECSNNKDVSQARGGTKESPNVSRDPVPERLREDTSDSSPRMSEIPIRR